MNCDYTVPSPPSDISMVARIVDIGSGSGTRMNIQRPTAPPEYPFGREFALYRAEVPGGGVA